MKRDFEYLKFNNIELFAEQKIIGILEELCINPKILKNISTKYLVELIKPLINVNDDIENIKRVIIKYLKIKIRTIVFSDDEYDYIWEVLEDPADGIRYRKIAKRKRKRSFVNEEEIVFNKNSREVYKKYTFTQYQNDFVISNSEIEIKYEVDGNNNRSNIVNVKNLFNNSCLSFIIENGKKELVDKEYIYNYLDKNNITFHRRVLSDRDAKIYSRELDRIDLLNEKIKEKFISSRQRGGFYRTRFDSAETDD